MLKKIVAIGPECTGKSTLSQQLAEHYHTAWCPEYAREYLLKYGKKYTYDDLLTIAKGQIELEEKIIQSIANYVNYQFCSYLIFSMRFVQVIMVQLRNGTYPHMEKVAALVKKPGALAPLEAMLNPGKSALPVVAPTEIPSTYTLNYLPKLKSSRP